MKVALVAPGKKERRVSFRVEAGIIKVDEQHGVVVAKACPEPDIVLTLAERVYGGILTMLLKDGRLAEQLLMPEYVTAVARCHGDDVFDEEKGMEVALTKLEGKLRKAVAARFAILAKELRATADNLEKFS